MKQNKERQNAKYRIKFTKVYAKYITRYIRRDLEEKIQKLNGRIDEKFVENDGKLEKKLKII